MSARSATTIASITLGAAAVAGIGYCFYFDHQRRNNPEFRKGLKKQQKQIAAAAEARTKAEKEKHKKYIANALREIQNEEPPVTPEASEAYFQEHVAEAERLALLGSESHAESAVEFFKALRVYPQPVELLMIYQKVCPPPIFALVLEMTSMGEAAGPGRTGAGAGNVLGGIDAEDIDDDSPNSPNARSQSSGNDWEQLSQGAA